MSRIAILAGFAALIAGPAAAADLCVDCRPMRAAPVAVRVAPAPAYVIEELPPRYIVDQGPDYSGPGLINSPRVFPVDDVVRDYPYVGGGWYGPRHVHYGRPHYRVLRSRG